MRKFPTRESCGKTPRARPSPHRSKNVESTAPEPAAADRRPIPNLVIEARRYSALAVDTLVELTKDSHTDSTRYAAATALLDRGYGRPAQSLDLHLSTEAITKRLSDMTDAELAALEQRMIAAAPIVLEATAEEASYRMVTPTPRSTASVWVTTRQRATARRALGAKRGHCSVSAVHDGKGDVTAACTE